MTGAARWAVVGSGRLDHAIRGPAIPHRDRRRVDDNRGMRLPRQPVRTLIRFLWRAVVAWIAVGLDLRKPESGDGPPPRRRGDVIRDSCRRDEVP